MCSQDKNKDKSAEISVPESLALVDFFQNPRIIGLFTVLVGTGTIISLLPLFLGFLLESPDWLSQLLATSLGYLTLLLILVSVFLGVIFMIFISATIFSEFYLQVIKKPYLKIDKFFSLITISCFLVSFFAISIVLINVWAIKAISTFNFITSLTIIYFGILIGLVLFVFGIVIIMNLYRGTCQIKPIDRIKKIKIWRWLLIAIIVVLVVLLGYFLFQLLVGPTSLILNYYNDKNKSISLNLSFNESVGNNTPTILHLKQTATDVKNIGVDLYYLECRWSTNYGHFIEINANNSEIIRHQQEVVFPKFPKCPTAEDNIYWTYNDDLYGKNKPDVLIGFTIKDHNKGTILGSNYMLLTWNQTDYLIQKVI